MSDDYLIGQSRENEQILTESKNAKCRNMWLFVDGDDWQNPNDVLNFIYNTIGAALSCLMYCIYNVV